MRTAKIKIIKLSAMDYHVRTYTGRMVDLVNPKPEYINIEDIARSLSRLERFNGHTFLRLDVAWHSVTVSRYIEEQCNVYDRAVLLGGLLHDAAESYVGDIVSPLKSGLSFNGEPFSILEGRILDCIMAKFGGRIEEIVKMADEKLCAIEGMTFMGWTDKFIKSEGLPRVLKSDLQWYNKQLLLKTVKELTSYDAFMERIQELIYSRAFYRSEEAKIMKV